MRPVISVIIPTLNEENYLPKLLTDLKKQTEKKFEVIIVDGYSDDKTKEVVSMFKHDLNLYFFNSSKRHLALQRNIGANKAKGEYLFFVDADTRIKSDAIEKAIFHITQEHHGVYLPVIVSSNPRLSYKTLVASTVILVKLLQKIGIPLSIGPIILIKKDLFDTIGGFSLQTTASEDHNLIIKAYKKGEKARFLSDVGCTFSMRRFERDGICNILWKYTIFTIETLIKGGVYKKSNYEMGGHNYENASVTE